MIVINIFDDEISIKGHAGYAERGKDIVCAAISVLTQSLIRSIETLTTDRMEYSLSDGQADIKFRNLSKTSSILISSFLIGVLDIEKEYPENVKIICPSIEDIKSYGNSATVEHSKS